MCKIKHNQSSNSLILRGYGSFDDAAALSLIIHLLIYSYHELLVSSKSQMHLNDCCHTILNESENAEGLLNFRMSFEKQIECAVQWLYFFQLLLCIYIHLEREWGMQEKEDINNTSMHMNVWLTLSYEIVLLAHCRRNNNKNTKKHDGGPTT